MYISFIGALGLAITCKPSKDHCGSMNNSIIMKHYVLVCINLTIMQGMTFFGGVHWQGIGKLHLRWSYCQSFHRMYIILSYLTSPMHHHPTWSSSHSLCPQLNQLTSLPWHSQSASSLFLQTIRFQHFAVKNPKANCPTH